MQQNSEPTVVPLHGTRQAEEVARERNEMLEAFLIRSRQTEMMLHTADVTISNQIAEEGTQIWAHLIRDRDRNPLRGQRFARRPVLVRVIECESRRQPLPALPNRVPIPRAPDAVRRHASHSRGIAF